MEKLTGKVAIVTGAARGLGRAFARALAKAGAAVAIVDILEKEGHNCAEEIIAEGGQAIFINCDVSSRQQIEAAVAETIGQFGAVDILVNNAMATPPQFTIENTIDEDMESLYQTGPMAAARFMQTCLPYLKNRGGKVINLASGTGITGMENYGCYAAAKEAIRGFTRSAAKEWGHLGINVNCICPAAATDKLMELEKESPELFTRIISDIPLQRLGDPERDIAPVVVFLASDDARYITGETIMIDGGHTMRA